MATNLALDDKLIVEAQKIGHHRSKRDAVTQALKDYITHKKQLRIFDLFGKIEYDPEYHYKEQRKRA